MRDTFRLTIPILMGYIPLSIAFAVAWVQADLPAWGAILASVFLYAGSMQFLLIGLLTAGVGLDTVLLATLAVNLRHIFYGLSFPTAPYRGHPLALGYAMFSLTDEAYSVISQLPKNTEWQKISAVLLLCQGYWLAGTLIGIIAGALIPPSIFGFDFALGALFLVIAQNHAYRRERRPALALGLIAIAIAFAAVYCLHISEQQILAIAISLLLALLCILPRRAILPEGA